LVLCLKLPVHRPDPPVEAVPVEAVAVGVGLAGLGPAAGCELFAQAIDTHATLATMIR
jgi:hypothetical protein